MGVGTGWTVYSIKDSNPGSNEASLKGACSVPLVGARIPLKKPCLNSIRCGKSLDFFSCSAFLNRNCVCSRIIRTPAIMFSTMSQSAWDVPWKAGSVSQAQNPKSMSVHATLLQFKPKGALNAPPSNGAVASKDHTFHQRLNMEHHSNDFYQWFVGMTDGDGCFSVVCQNQKWSLIFKISLSTYNLRALYFIKKHLGVGAVTIDKKNQMGSFLIRDRKKFQTTIFSVFDKFPLLTTKYFYYLRLKRVYEILENPQGSKLEKDHQIWALLKQEPCSTYISPVWAKIACRVEGAPRAVWPTNLDVEDIKKIMSKAWIVGFVEAEGSFYITKKDTSGRMAHGFGIAAQKRDPIVLESIKRILHIKSKVKYRRAHNFNSLDTTQKRAIDNISVYFHENLVGIKSFEFKIWKRSLKHRNTLAFEHLLKVQGIMRKIRSKRFVPVNDDGIVRSCPRGQAYSDK
uniref:LAGLIDADG homing endonuclease n=1 Tax=Marophrys sp. SRT127 TaxID=2488311 RepID=A0A455RGQ0_9EUKA|nr:LAGLIDADG homing endonuclease [Marophrys sp. SRT127]